MTAEVITISNWKGGVGKTTTAITLAYGLARQSRKVLLIDADGQMNTTWTIQQKLYVTSHDNLYDPIVRRKPLAPVVQTTTSENHSGGHPNLYFVPSSTWISGADYKLAGEAARERRMERAIAPFLDEVDYIIIDTSPNLGIMTMNAIVASTYILIPVVPAIYGLIGMDMILKTILSLQESMGRPYPILGVLITQLQATQRNASEHVQKIRDFFGPLVFENMIPKNVKVEEAAGVRESLFDYAPSSSGAKAYRNLVDEILLRQEQWGRSAFVKATSDILLNVSLDEEEV